MKNLLSIIGVVIGLWVIVSLAKMILYKPLIVKPIVVESTVIKTSVTTGKPTVKVGQKWKYCRSNPFRPHCEIREVLEIRGDYVQYIDEDMYIAEDSLYFFLIGNTTLISE